MRGDEVIGALGALAQDDRLAAYRLLVQAGRDGLAAGAIAEALDLPASSLSSHLAQLQFAGLITQRRNGRSLFYALDYAVMARLIGYLTENCSRGTGCGEAPGYREVPGWGEEAPPHPDGLDLRAGAACTGKGTAL